MHTCGGTGHGPLPLRVRSVTGLVGVPWGRVSAVQPPQTPESALASQRAPSEPVRGRPAGGEAPSGDSPPLRAREGPTAPPPEPSRLRRCAEPNRSVRLPPVRGLDLQPRDWPHVTSLLLSPASEVSVREESDNDQNQSDDGDPEASPTKSPTTPKSVKSKSSSGTAQPPDVTDRPREDAGAEARPGGGGGLASADEGRGTPRAGPLPSVTAHRATAGLGPLCPARSPRLQTRRRGRHRRGQWGGWAHPRGSGARWSQLLTEVPT